MKHWYTMVEIPDADTRAQKGDTLDTSEKIIIAAILIIVCAVTFIVASCFAGTIQRHVFEAGVAFDADGRVVASTETIRGEQ